MFCSGVGGHQENIGLASGKVFADTLTTSNKSADSTDGCVSAEFILPPSVQKKIAHRSLKCFQ